MSFAGHHPQPHSDIRFRPTPLDIELADSSGITPHTYPSNPVPNSVLTSINAVSDLAQFLGYEIRRS